jgi:hypothetical protein
MLQCTLNTTIFKKKKKEEAFRFGAGPGKKQNPT